ALAHEPAVGLPHGVEAAPFGVLHEAHGVTDGMGVLEIERDRHARHAHSRLNSRTACSAARDRTSWGSTRVGSPSFSTASPSTPTPTAWLPGVKATCHGLWAWS